MKNHQPLFLKRKKNNLLKYFMLLPIFALILTHTLSFFQLSKKNILLANTSWTTYAATKYDSGTGSPTDPFIIKTAQQLARVAKQVNSGFDKTSYFKLSNYIDLKQYNWVPIGTSEHNFGGGFDGNGNAILNLKNSSDTFCNGLFGVVYGATIKNIFLLGGSINSSSNYLGSAVGYATNSNISQIYSTVSIKNNNNDSTTGGIVGYAEGSSLWLLAKKSATNGKTYTGGIVGNARNTAVSYSYNEGNVSGTNGTGGIVGLISKSTQSYELKESFNIGEISGSNFVGGIAGESSSVDIRNVFNNGPITKSGNNVGGIAGKTSSLTISQAYNQKNITSSGSNVGGIVGDATTSTIITNTHNEGNITSTSKNIGGIAGYAEDAGSISKSINKGDITTTSREWGTVGGILGKLRFTSASSYYIDENGNEGHIKANNADTGYSSSVGGILGAMYNDSITEPTLYIRENYNSGKVEGKYNIGGIIGAMSRGIKYNSGKNNPDTKYPTRIIMNYNANVGIMKSYQQLGGLIGDFLAEDVTNLTLTGNYYGGYVEREHSKTYNNIGTFTGRNVYHDYNWSRASSNYFVYDSNSDYYNSREVFPIGDYYGGGDFNGFNANYRYSGTIEQYMPGIYVFPNYYLNSEDIRSMLSSSYFSNSTGKLLPMDARKNLISQNLDSAYFQYNADYTNGNHPVLKVFYWAENASPDDQTEIYNVFIDTNGGASLSNKTYAVSSASQNIYLGSPTKAGYTFSHWSISQASNGASISGNYLNLSARFSADITVVANWTAKLPALSYSIIPNSTIFAKNGGSVKITVHSGSGTITISDVSSGISNVRTTGNVINLEILSMPDDARFSRMLSITISRSGYEPETITFTQSILGIADPW